MQPVRALPPLLAYVIASALVWAVLQPLVDWATGDLDSVAKSALKGGVIGLVWGVSMFAFESWLTRRSSKKGP